jgi:hypothetical protein
MKTALESERLEKLYRKASDPVLRTHLLMVWRMSLGDSVGEVVGYSKKWTTEILKRYERGGVEALGNRRHSNPGAKERALLDEAGEAEMLEALRGPVPASVGGGMWSGPKVALDGTETARSGCMSSEASSVPEEDRIQPAGSKT